MKLYIALALSCLSTGALAGEVGMSSTDGGPSTQANTSANESPKDTTSDAGGPADGQVNLISAHGSSQNSALTSLNVDAVASPEATVATVDTTPMTSTETSYTALDGVTYGLEKGSMNPVGGDAGVNLAPKQPNAYDDRAYVQLHKSSSTNTPFKRPEIEVGILVGGSGSYIPVNETLINTPGAFPPAKYKFYLSGEGLSGGGSVGANWRRGNNTFGAVMTGYLDSHTLKNYDHKDDIYSHDINPSMTFLKRNYTLEFAAKAGHYFDDLHLYGKLGFMCSAFQYKYRNTDVDRRKNITAWGGVAGIGLQKPISLPVLNDTRIGIEYNYQIYESLTPVIKYSTNIDTAKLRPRYHNGYITLSKTF